MENVLPSETTTPDLTNTSSQNRRESIGANLPMKSVGCGPDISSSTLDALELESTNPLVETFEQPSAPIPISQNLSAVHGSTKGSFYFYPNINFSLSNHRISVGLKFSSNKLPFLYFDLQPSLDGLSVPISSGFGKGYKAALQWSEVSFTLDQNFASSPCWNVDVSQSIPSSSLGNKIDVGIGFSNGGSVNDSRGLESIFLKLHCNFEPELSPRQYGFTNVALLYLRKSN